MSAPSLVYFSAVNETTKRFIDKLDFPSQRIPVRKTDEPLILDYDYVLVIPTYGGGNPKTAVPRRVVEFLRPVENRRHCLGIIAAGNKNFGPNNFALGGRHLAEILGIPLLYKFEVSGTETDVRAVAEGLPSWWEGLTNGGAV